MQCLPTCYFLTCYFLLMVAITSQSWRFTSVIFDFTVLFTISRPLPSPFNYHLIPPPPSLTVISLVQIFICPPSLELLYQFFTWSPCLQSIILISPTHLSHFWIHLSDIVFISTWRCPNWNFKLSAFQTWSFPHFSDLGKWHLLVIQFLKPETQL